MLPLVSHNTQFPHKIEGILRFGEFISFLISGGYKRSTFSNPVIFRRGVNVELRIAGKRLEKQAFLEMIQGSLEHTNWKVNEKSILVNLGILHSKLEGE